MQITSEYLHFTEISDMHEASNFKKLYHHDATFGKVFLLLSQDSQYNIYVCQLATIIGTPEVLELLVEKVSMSIPACFTVSQGCQPSYSSSKQLF